MDRWAVRYAGRASFVCACCDGPGLAETFASELHLRHCLNVWVDRAGMPRWGQLGCQGFIICNGRGAVTCRATSAFLDVEGRAFRHVETLLGALLGDEGAGAGPGATVAAGTVPPGATCEVHSLANRPDLNGIVVTCVEAPDAATGGRCLVRTADGRGMKIRPANLRIVERRASRGGCGGCDCGDGNRSCDREAGTPARGEKTGGKRKAAAGTAAEDPAAEEDAREAARARAAPPVAGPAPPRPPAKREAFKGGMSLGVCANDRCLCADCECGKGCTCNVASREVEQADTCEPCTDFRRQKAAGGAAAAPAPACTPGGSAAADAPSARK